MVVCMGVSLFSSDNNGCMYGCVVVVFRNVDTVQPGDCAAHDWLVTSRQVITTTLLIVKMLGAVRAASNMAPNYIIF